MRQGHQNRRGRSRSSNNNNNNNSSSGGSSNNRKGQNPLTRTFESNGPDVKIRGTPAHIAEKYITLARDAKSSGDEVLAENYLQHAEHYNRIILAFREQQVGQGADTSGAAMGQRFRVPQLQDGMEDDDFGDEGDDFGPDQQQPVMRQNEPQPSLAQPQPPFEGGERHEGRDHQRPERQERHQGGGHRYDDRPRRHPDQFRNRDREPRQNDFPRTVAVDRPVEPHGFVPDRGGLPPAAAIEPGFEPINGQRPRPEPAPRGDRPERVVPDRAAAERGEAGGPRRRERFQPPSPHEQPEFLRRPVRRPRRDAAPAEGGEVDTGGAAPPTPPVRDDGGSHE